MQGPHYVKDRRNVHRVLLGYMKEGYKVEDLHVGG